MITTLITSVFVALAQAAGQSIQNWINSTEGQQCINNAITIIGKEGLLRIFQKLGL